MTSPAVSATLATASRPRPAVSSPLLLSLRTNASACATAVARLTTNPTNSSSRPVMRPPTTHVDPSFCPGTAGTPDAILPSPSTVRAVQPTYEELAKSIEVLCCQLDACRGRDTPTDPPPEADFVNVTNRSLSDDTEMRLSRTGTPLSPMNTDAESDNDSPTYPRHHEYVRLPVRPSPISTEEEDANLARGSREYSASAPNGSVLRSAQCPQNDPPSQLTLHHNDAGCFVSPACEVAISNRIDLTDRPVWLRSLNYSSSMRIICNGPNTTLAGLFYMLSREMRPQCFHTSLPM